MMVSAASPPAVSAAARRAGAVRAAGFTLIELMVSIAIVVLLMVVAAPSFVDIRKNAQLSDAVSSLILATSTAKAAALKTGLDSYVVVNDTSIGWASGWYVFIDKDFDQTYDTGVEEVLLQHDAVPSAITVTAPDTTAFSAGYLRFTGGGYPRTKAGATGRGTVVMATPKRSSTVVVDTSGRVRSCTSGSTGCSAL